jgi:hypothetical protein
MLYVKSGRGVLMTFSGGVLTGVASSPQMAR